MAQQPDTLPILVDFECYRGDDWTRGFELVTPSGPLDMTGWTGLMQIRDEVDGTIRLTASSANSRITTGPQSSGGRTWQLMVYLTGGDTATLPPGFVGRYDIQMFKPDGKPVTLYHGQFCVEGDISK